jgi:chromosome segregation ATPase
METLPPQAPDSNTWLEQFAGSLQAQRDRAREFLTSQLARLERAETSLEARIKRLEENAEIQRRLIRAQAAAASQGGRLDWEAEKRRVLAALESDLDPNDPQQQAERLRIEKVLQTTEQALADKDRQIEELEHRLGDNARGRDADSAAIEGVLDGDAVVQQERERLRELQEQWREKLSQAEIELSVQRAKLARDRAELDERLRFAEATLPQVPTASDPADRQKRSAPGRWLARLGLTEDDRNKPDL